MNPAALILFALQATALQVLPRKSVNGDDYPACNPQNEGQEACVAGGKYLVPPLDFASRNSEGDQAFTRYLPAKTYQLSRWTNHMMPASCEYWGHQADQFNATDFVIYNVTYPDCTAPWVVCQHVRAPVKIDQVASTISRIPVRIRQYASTFMAYSHDNPNYGGVIATLADDGLIVGRSDFYFPTALVHELGHAVDSNARLHSAAGAYSITADWLAAINADGYAVSAYGAGSSVEDFADVGRAVLLDNIVPGGLRAFSHNNANLSQITNQLSKFKAKTGNVYVPGGTCDLTRKFPFPPLVPQQ